MEGAEGGKATDGRDDTVERHNFSEKNAYKNNNRHGEKHHDNIK